MLIVLACTLTAGCIPAHFTNEHKKELEKDHAKEAKAWFEENLPEAKMAKNVEACVGGQDLLCALRGTYEYEKQEYPFVYDFYNEKMYLGHDYERVEDLVKETVQKELGYTEKEVEVSFNEIAVSTHTDNDKEQDLEFAESFEKGVLPALIDPKKLAKELVYDGDVTGYYVTVYAHEIPEYDHRIFEKMQGLMLLTYVKPVSFDGTDIYRSLYTPEKAVQKRITLTEEEGICGGYFYAITEEIGEDGEVLSHVDELGGEDPEMSLSVENDGIILSVPKTACPIVFVPERANYYSDTDKSNTRWTEAYKEEEFHYEYEGWFDSFNGSPILPHSDLFAYYITMYKNNTGKYSLKLPKEKE